MGIAALILSLSAFLSRILGSLREVVISARHGASGMTDAYYAAFTLPELMNYFLAGGTLSITFIPLFSAYMTRDDEAGGWRLFSTLITTMGLILLGFTLVGLWATPWVVTRMFSGFDDPAQRALLIQMTRIVMPAQLAFYVGGLLQSTLFVRETFWPAAVAPLVYNELHRIAVLAMRRESEGHTLQPTELVHEAFARVVGQRQVDWQCRSQFYGLAAQAIRRILIDHARRRRAIKRDHGLRVTLDESVGGVAGRSLDLIALDDALRRLAELDERQARVVELRFFGGLDVAETAESLGISPATVKRDWTFARAFLLRELGDPPSFTHEP